MLRNMVNGSGWLALLSLVACGGSVRSIGDSPVAGQATGASSNGGSAASAGGATARGGATSAGGATARGGATNAGGLASPGDCASGCVDGYGCARSADTDSGVCVPVCDDPEARQTPNAPTDCSRSVRGGVGTCVFAQTYAPAPGDVSMPSGETALALCSNACDPLAQDCPSGFSCDLSETFSEVDEAQALYVCMPVVKPGQLGDDCEGTESGHCAPGLTCNPFPNLIYQCVAFCELGSTNTCAGSQTCQSSELTTLVGDQTVGVCLD